MDTPLTASANPKHGAKEGSNLRAPIQFASGPSPVQAVEYVKSGMVLGLGTGSTAAFAVARIGELLKVHPRPSKHSQFVVDVEAGCICRCNNVCSTWGLVIITSLTNIQSQGELKQSWTQKHLLKEWGCYILAEGRAKRHCWGTYLQGECTNSTSLFALTSS